MGKPLANLSEVSDTMLITLYARAHETLSANPIIHDPKAVEIIEHFKKELKGSKNPIHQKILTNSYPPKLGVSMALRSRRFDRYVKDWMILNPCGTVVNFGCGLDTRFDRLDNGQLHWYDIDFPSVIALRRRFITENQRHRFIERSILDPLWMNEVGKNAPFLFLAEGVFMYLQEEQVKDLLSMIKGKFPGSELVCEVTNSYWVKKMSSRWMQWKFKHQLGMQKRASFSFGVPDGHYFHSWDEDYQFLDEWTYFDDKEKKFGLYNLMSHIDLLRKVQWTLHYRIGKS